MTQLRSNGFNETLIQHFIGHPSVSVNSSCGTVN